MRLSIYDDFFKLGGDSLLAVKVVAKLQKNYKITVNEFLKSPTIAKIVEVISFVKDNLDKKLRHIEDLLLRKEQYSAEDVNAMLVKHSKYLASIQNIAVTEQKKNIRSVLLTGVTGHVGCNILYHLLHSTGYKIYLLIRASSYSQAIDRLNNKFNYYFASDLSAYKDRIIVLIADIEQNDLGLSGEQYQELVTNVDSIIHSAALVKHYGTYEEMYQGNVRATINLLELSKLTVGKDFHYISTIGILLQGGYIEKYSYFLFQEDDDVNIISGRNNLYARTKYEGELAVKEYRKQGVVANIYRLGNVAMHSVNYKHQENIKANAFVSLLKAMTNINMVYKTLLKAEVSPVDYTALAIVKIFDQLSLNNQVYHIFNPHLCDLSKMFENNGLRLRVTPIHEFINEIIMQIKNNRIDNTWIEPFMLHQGWLEEINVKDVTGISVLQDRTNAILAQLGFYWPVITNDMWSGVVEYIFSGDPAFNS